MSITLPLSFWFPRKFFVFLLLSTTFINSILCVRSSGSSAESTGGAGSLASGSSLVPTSSSHHHRGDRELLSAQFRAAQDARDLDTSESSVSVAGLESLTAAAAAAGLEDDPLALSKYMAASASAYAPSKIARLNGYRQTGFYDPYPSIPGAQAAALNSVPSSYYPYNAYSSYRDTNPMLDTYPYYERDRIKELRDRAMQAAQSAPYSHSSSSGGSSNREGSGGFFGGGFREGFRSNDHDSTAMSSGHGGHGDEHGHGNGWGWGMYTSKVNTNAIGLLGLIGLLSLLSNVLMQFTTTTTTTTMAMGGGRKKRSLSEEEEVLESREERMERIFMEILPHLTPVAHARDGVIPLECTFNGVCMANRVLVNEFGVNGRAGGMKISSAIVKLLEKISSQNSTDSGRSHESKPVNKPGKHLYKGKKGSDIRKRLESAGLDGRNKKDCQKSYPVCEALQTQVMPTFPFTIRIQDLPELIFKANKLSPGSVPMKL